MFSSELNYANPVPETLHDLVNVAYVRAHAYSDYNDAYKKFTQVILHPDVLDADARTDNAVLLEDARATRERAWVLCLAEHNGVKILGFEDIDCHAELQQAKQDTASLLGIPEGARPRDIVDYLSQLHDRRLRQDTRTISSEHARTIFTMGRITVLEQYMSGEITEGKVLAPEERRRVAATHADFGRNAAYGFAQLGNQPDLLVEIALHGARAEKAKGGKISSTKAARWMLREASGIFQTLGQGHGETIVDTVGMVREFAPFLASQQRAASSINTHP